MTFLHSVAERILKEQDYNLIDTLVVFNNRRAGLFLQNELQSLAKSPFFLPSIIGMDDLVNSLCDLNIAPHEFLLFELFDIHRNIGGDDRKFDSFEEFISFGEMMINDFSQIDLYCVDAKRLFDNTYAQKRLCEWDVSGKPLTTFQEKYLSFYSSLHSYYCQLRQRLFDQSKAYTGMAYRYVAENIGSLVNRIKHKHIYFVGFNALSASEQLIIDALVPHKATLICDGDEYYCSDNNQEAGHFLRKLALHYDHIGPFTNHFKQNTKKIHIVNCPENVLQAKTAGLIIKQLANGPDKKDALKHCAVVLSDEKLLMPVLNSLPAEIDATNVTMGFPFSLSNIYNLANAVLSLYCHVRKGRFHHADITALLSDPLAGKAFGTNDMAKSMAKKINKDKIIYASPDDIAALSSDLSGFEKMQFIFKNAEPSVDDTLDILKQLAATIVQSRCLGKNNKEKESLACFVQIVDYFINLQAQYHAIEKIDTLKKIYQRIAQRRSVAFYGEPLHGMQILGVLETRSLDFPYLIMTSVNEGTIPSGRTANSLIPYSLTHDFKLPSFIEKDAVYAYNFFRLLQRTDEAWLLYSSYAEGLGKGEPSRFIRQIRDELATIYPSVKVDEYVVSAKTLNASTERVSSMPKDEQALQKLAEYAEKGFSPSALNQYRSCPMKFYYTNIIGVNADDEVSEDIESNELGSFIHSILCEIYNRDTDKTIRSTTLTNALNDIPEMVDNRIQDDLLKGRSNEGRNHLYGEVAKMQLSRFLKREISLLDKHSIKMELTEDSLEAYISANGTKVKIHGIADRIDYFDGLLRIADYKSGSVDDNELIVDDKKPNPHDVPDKWFQLLCYAWLYCRTHKFNGTLSSGIFPLRTLGGDFMPASWTNCTELHPDDIDRFETMLSNIISEIMDPNIDFVANPLRKACLYCPMALSCQNKIES